MFSAVQILLMAVVVVLASLSVVIGIQVFKLIKQLRQIASQLNLSLKEGKIKDEIFRFMNSHSDEAELELTGESGKENSSPLVSVNQGLRPSSSPVRSFYRRGRSLS